jgi:hypothetical protein
MKTSATFAIVLCLSTTLALAGKTGADQDGRVVENARQEIRIPPGFAKVSRGKHVLYCKKDSIIGTRFKSEKCFDEAGMRDYILAQQQNNRDFDRARSTCSSMAACGGS